MTNRRQSSKGKKAGPKGVDHFYGGKKKVARKRGGKVGEKRRGCVGGELADEGKRKRE